MCYRMDGKLIFVAYSARDGSKGTIADLNVFLDMLNLLMEQRPGTKAVSGMTMFNCSSSGVPINTLSASPFIEAQRLEIS